MQLKKFSFVLLPLAVNAVNIVLANDDGWAEINIRTFYSALTAAGESVVLSAPAENESGTGSSDATPTTLTEPCEYDTCPSGSPAEGSDSSNPRFNYVNSYPVTAMRYGIQTLSKKFFDGLPDLAVSGFNVGANLGTTALISGTVGAATEAVKEGIPAIAFSGSTGSQISYKTNPVPNYVNVYADLSANVTQALVASGKPYLPAGVWLNVNFAASSGSECASTHDFEFVLTRIGDEGGAGDDGTSATTTATTATEPGAEICGQSSLPTESTVVQGSGCYASISVGNATNKDDASPADQALVYQKLKSILSCYKS